ncbi:MAG: hypothetical protein EU541_08340 [Promethearchaeota archaeon]|nr:MAG: hypothetical protein EU541_08340 [Candidatus Lokiarchaeota archaeon]
MTNTHDQSFFGQNVAVFVQSTSKYEDFIFLKCIKRKVDNLWEKPSQGEGKYVKMSLGEMVMILKVLKAEIESWSTYHSFKDEGTNISFNWSHDILWINIGDYSKKLKSPQIEIFTLLLDHLLKEKIEFATGSKKKENVSKPVKTDTETSNKATSVPRHLESSDNKNLKSIKHSGFNLSNQNDSENQYDPLNKKNVYVKEEIVRSKRPSIKNSKSYGKFANEKDSEARNVRGEIRRATKKALLIQFQDGLEAWIPKSTVHNDFSTETDHLQSFLIDKWVLEKNQVIS